MENNLTAAVPTETERKGISRSTLKYIVIAAMVLDHIAWGIVDDRAPLIGQIMHFFGRLTGPTMAFFLAEGYRYTRSVKRYQLRLGIFALVSWLPYAFFEAGIDGLIKEPFQLLMQSVIFTLFLGITAIRVWDSEKLGKPAKVLIIIGLTLLSLIGDWPIMDVLAPLFLHIYRDNRRNRYIAMVLIYFPLNLIQLLSDPENNWFAAGVLLVPVLVIGFYNGKGGKKSAFNKWFFYIFYPAHLVVLGILRWYVFGGN